MIKTNVFAQKSFEGSYIIKGYNSGAVLIVRPDYSFSFRYRGHISSDTASGYYRRTGDTLVLKYVYNNYDSIFASYQAGKEQVPAHIQLSAGRATLRPHRLLKRGKRLYYLDVKTGQVATHNFKGKVRKTYLRLYTK